MERRQRDRVFKNAGPCPECRQQQQHGWSHSHRQVPTVYILEVKSISLNSAF